MAGIKANSASATMGDGDTAADKSVTGYITGEAITLSTTPTGTSYSWGHSRPTGSTARSDLSATTGATPVFTPDVAGYYVVTCVVDSTTSYVLRIGVTQVALTTSYEAIRFSPKADADIPTPTVGAAGYFSSDGNRLTEKDSAGDVWSMGSELTSYTVTTLPAATLPTRLIYVSDETGGATVAFNDGTNWRRVQDRAIVS